MTATMRLVSLAVIGQLAFGAAALADEMTDTTGDGGTTATMTMETDGGGDGTMTGDGMTGTMDMPSDDAVGAADSLSAGNRKIAEALFESQTIGDSGTQALSLDQIAAAKQSGQGWGEIFHQLKADGLIDAKNLGQVVSGHYRPAAETNADTTVVITNAEGQTAAVATVGGSGSGHGVAGEGAPGAHGGGHANGHGAGHGGGITTAGGGALAGAGHGGGHAYGLGGGAGHGARAGGVTTAGGGAGSAGIAHGGGHANGHGRGLVK